ncbi:hypothetical protein HBH56_186050 [Parastagonospora nodorum]|uniref:Uncharacterized protein n=2 Tax=Phaeosphaeria nodorum (strain SN15 / ATCC MYA-4574 / FGSC 10173) TaxID=321614 RepID=A0A7U2I436_PHANO|nr:hypothetical protein SNOG_15343 [Parastagonospora nodorum SN15]KAH3907663.1 hypothetical protein HBH56_186050 [Parastagonospora nodorum]EAT77276.1 hypothetical protein SNOG_15343 [Parastagonospora nodorum SN15]KAH3925332.1 hypothetical protein HBH54_182510 [Parastagonospora nodorum]KAH4113254.1 hypothetical protein HBH47_213370 [Parastagonospora nodorum]KAH4127267.1 hypothetical protein HBH45_219420 [Parastagonospora nodorum]
MQGSHPNDTALCNILALMGDDASLLNFLPLGEVELIPLESNTKLVAVVPYRMHFGLINNGGAKKVPVGIMVYNGLIPTILDVRWARFSQSGQLQSNTSISKVAQNAEPGAAFRCLRQKTGMSTKHLRALVRYYFIAKKVNLPSVWPVDEPFVKDLTSACRLAKANLDKDAGRLASQRMSSQRSVEPPGYKKKNVAKVYESLNPQLDQIQTRAMSEDDIVPPINIKSSEFDFEDDGPEIPTVLQSYQQHGYPQQGSSSQAGLSASTTASMTFSDTVNAMSVPLPNIANLHQDKTSQPTTPDSDPTDFFKTYRHIVEAEDTHKDELRHNMIKQEEAYNKMLALKAHFKILQEEAEGIKLKEEQNQGQRKRLRESLSDKERSFLDFTMEIEGARGKRVRRSEEE